MEKEVVSLACCLDRELARGGFNRLDPTPTAPEIEISAAWKQKTWGHVRGVAAVSVGRFTNHPGDFAHCVKRRVARAIGYFWLFHRVTLHLVIHGEGILGRSEELNSYMEGPIGGMALESIHVVDLNASQALAHYSAESGPFEDLLQPMHQGAMQAAGVMLRRAARAILRPMPVRLRLDYSRQTGRATRSVCFQGGPSAECVTLLDRGVEAFIYGYRTS